MKPYTDCMIDLETLGISDTAVILQIGMVFFNRYDERPHMIQSWYPDVDEQLNAGHTVEWETVQWWSKQAGWTAQVDAPRYMKREEITDEFVKTWGSATTKETNVWAKGTPFDIVKLKTYLGFDPFNYRHVQDLRTLKMMAAEMGATVDSHNDNPHDAVADARVQAQEVQALCSILKREK